jgi:hypothetical protein
VQERVFFGRIFAAVISIDKTKRVGGGCQPVTDGAAGGSQPGIVFVVRDCKPGNKMLHYAINVSMQVNSGRVESMVPGALTASVGLPLWQNCGNICLPRLRISFVFFLRASSIILLYPLFIRSPAWAGVIGKRINPPESRVPSHFSCKFRTEEISRRGRNKLTSPSLFLEAESPRRDGFDRRRSIPRSETTRSLSQRSLPLGPFYAESIRFALHSLRWCSAGRTHPQKNTRSPHRGCQTADNNETTIKGKRQVITSASSSQLAAIYNIQICRLFWTWKSGI